MIAQKYELHEDSLSVESVKKKTLKQVCHYEILFNMKKKLDFINLLENTIGKSAV